MIKRTLIFSAMACLGLSACEKGAIMSPEEEASVDPVLSLTALPLFEPPEECPAQSCPLSPRRILRETMAPTVVTEAFPGTEGETATLVVLASHPKTTTIKAWLNGVVVLLPSELPRSESNEVRMPVELLEENVLEVRLSAKPGTEVAVWIESSEGPGIEPMNPLPTSFRLTPQIFSPADDMSGACSGFGDGFGVADWNDVVQAVNDGSSKEDILGTGFALILRDGVGFFLTGFPFFEERHYALSAVGPDPQTVGALGTELFWLTSTTNGQPVLCIGPGS